MKIRLVISVIVTVFIIGSILIAMALDINFGSDVDTVKINHIVKTIEIAGITLILRPLVQVVWILP